MANVDTNILFLEGTNHTRDIIILQCTIYQSSHFTATLTYLLSSPNMLTAWQVYLPMDRQSISLSVKLPSYFICSSLVSNIHLMVDCGILSTVQFIVVLEFSLTVLLLEILEMVGWSTNNDKFKPHWIIYVQMYISVQHLYSQC